MHEPRNARDAAVDCAIKLPRCPAQAAEAEPQRHFKLHYECHSDCYAHNRKSQCQAHSKSELRTEAQRHYIQVYGLLWLLDQMATAGVANETLHAGLLSISAHPRCRLPADEIRARLDAWAKS